MNAPYAQRFREAAARFRPGNSVLFDEWESFSTAELEAYARRLGLLNGASISRQDLTRRLRARGVTPSIC